MKVAEALVNPRVRDGVVYFKSKYPNTWDTTRIETFRLRPITLKLKHTVFGADTGFLLQYKYKGGWKDVSNSVPIDWLIEETELVEPTKEMP